TAIALPLSSANGVAQTIAATATDYVLTVTSVNTFTVGQEVVLSGTAESFLNGTTVTVVSASGTAFAANYPTWSENYTNAADTGVATAAGGNTWTLVGNINLVDSDYTVSSVPPVANSTPYPDYTKVATANGQYLYIQIPPTYVYNAANQWPSSKWNLDG